VIVDVIFEKKVGDNWEPTSSLSLQPGETVRMRDMTGSLIEEGCRVAGKRGADPDSHVSYDLSLEPIGG